MKLEKNTQYLATNKNNVDYEFFVTAENETHYLFKFRKVGAEDWKEVVKHKSEVHGSGVARYKAKYSKLGRALR